MNQQEKASGRKVVSAAKNIPAAAPEIFELLADANRHHEIDGSGTVRQAAVNGPERLSLGAKFGMSMKMFGLPYRITNEVVEFVESETIAWRHLGHHIWRYHLEPIDETNTRVTESFRWDTARAPYLYDWLRLPTRNQAAIEETLERLAAVFGQEAFDQTVPNQD